MPPERGENKPPPKDALYDLETSSEHLCVRAAASTMIVASRDDRRRRHSNARSAAKTFYPGSDRTLLPHYHGRCWGGGAQLGRAEAYSDPAQAPGVDLPPAEVLV